MKKSLLHFFTILSLINTSKLHSQISQEWVNIFNGYGSFTECKAMVMDSHSNIYVTGYAHTINGDLYVTRKYGSNGSVLWHDELSSGTYGVPYDMTVDDSDNVYITGYHDQNNQDKKIYVIKYSAIGDTLWTQKFNPTSNDEVATSLHIDGNDDLVILGRSGNNILTVKYTNSGQYVWHRIFESPGGFFVPKTIVTDNLNNIYCSGYLNSSESKLFLVKYAREGHFQWIKYEYGTSNGYDSRKLITSDSRNNIYMTGMSRDTAAMNCMVLVKYDPDGNRIWKRYLTNGQGNAIALDSEDNPYVTGLIISPLTSYDIGVAKFDTAGSQIWYHSYSMTQNSVEEGKSIYINRNNNIYVLGSGYTTAYYSLVTIKYSLSGILKWTRQYTGGDNGVNIIANESNEVFISGNSNNYITIKYGHDLTGIDPNEGIAPLYHEITSNYPNPFNPSTRISYKLQVTGYIVIRVFDALGKEVATLVNDMKNAGRHEVEFNAGNLPSGVYFYSLNIDGNQMGVKRMALVK